MVLLFDSPVSFFGSRHIHNLPSGFSLIISGFTQSFQYSMGVMIPCSTIDSNSFFNLGCTDTAAFLAGCFTG